MYQKTAFLPVFCVLAGCLLAAGAYAGDPNQMAHWTFDEGAGDMVFDSSDYGNDGTIEGEPNWVPGVLGGALAFDGATNYIDCGNPANLNLTKDISVMAWLKTVNAGTYDNHISYVVKGDQCYSLKYFYSGQMQFHIYDDTWYAASYPVDVTFNDEWHHLAGTYDGSTVKLFVDGQLAGTNPHAGTIANSPYNVYIGSNAERGQRFFLGLMDDVQIYDRALADREIQSVMGGGKAISLSASLPVPDSATTELPRNTTLSWKPGFYADKHNVYFGTDYNDVNEAGVDDPRGVLAAENQDDPTFDPGLLDYGKTYYWRVDEINSPPDQTIYKGDVFQFTVLNFLVVDDFERYTNEEPNRIYEIWNDGWNTTNNGAVVGYSLTEMPDQETYVETSIKVGGDQSMPYFYDTNMKYSEAWLRQDGGQRDWTREGVAYLSLWFRGYRAYMGGFEEDPAGTFTVQGAGEDIFGYEDQFHFAYQEITGQATITAKVESLENVHPFARAGVMMRNDLSAGSRNIGLFVTPENGLRYQYRITDDAVTDREFEEGITAPYWLRIERTSGGLVRPYHSADGSTWTRLPLKQLKADGALLVGLAVGSHDPNQPARAVFSDVTITGTGSDGPWQDQDVGLTSNAPEPIYVALNDTGVVYYEPTDPNASDLATLNYNWTRWRMDLQAFADKGVDLTDVRKMAIGVGTMGDSATPGGEGLLFIDDIRLYRPEP